MTTGRSLSQASNRCAFLLTQPTPSRHASTAASDLSDWRPGFQMSAQRNGLCWAGKEWIWPSSDTAVVPRRMCICCIDFVAIRLARIAERGSNVGE
jgi:hypothetical protein